MTTLHPRSCPRAVYVTVGQDNLLHVHEGPCATSAGPREATAWGPTLKDAHLRAFMAWLREVYRHHQQATP